MIVGRRVGRIGVVGVLVHVDAAIAKTGVQALDGRRSLDACKSMCAGTRQECLGEASRLLRTSVRQTATRSLAMTESEPVTATALALENERLRTQLQQRLGELRACRSAACAAGAVEAERRVRARRGSPGSCG